VDSICPSDVPMRRTISNVGTLAAIAKLAKVCRSAYGVRYSRPRGPQRGAPVLGPERVQVEVAAVEAGKEDRGIQPNRHRVEGVQRALDQWHEPRDRALRLARQLHPSVREDAIDADQARLAIDVAALERDPLLGPQAGAGSLLVFGAGWRLAASRPTDISAVAPLPST
jgi:hypothetical protein